MANFTVIHRGLCPDIFGSSSRILSYIDKACAESSKLKDVLDGYSLNGMLFTESLDESFLDGFNVGFNINDFGINAGTNDIETIVKTAGFFISHNFKRYKIFVSDFAAECYTADFGLLTETAENLRNTATSVMLIPATKEEIRKCAGYIQGDLCFNRSLFPRDCYYLDEDGYCSKPGMARVLCIEVPDCNHYRPRTTFDVKTAVTKGKDKVKHFSYPFSLFLLMPVSDDKTQLLSDGEMKAIMLPGFSDLPD